MTVRRRPDNQKWQARWYDHEGHQRAKDFDRKADADAFLIKTLGDLQRGTYIPPAAGTTRLTAWADQWLASAMNLGQGGRDTYRRDLDRHILPALGQRKLAGLTATTIDTYLADQLTRGLAPSTVHRHYRTLRRMLQVAVDRQLLARNPCDHVTPPTVHHHQMRFLTVTEVRALHDAIPDRYRSWVHVAAYTGIRWSEAVGLQRHRIDGNRLTIADQLVRRADNQWHREHPKTRAGRRTITMPTFVADELAAHLDQWAQPHPDGLVFPNRLGNPMNGPSFRGSIYGPACARAGLATPHPRPGRPPLIVGAPRIHDLRHTAVALAIAAGAHPKVIQARMGHATIAVTLDRYGHLFPEADTDLADSLDQLGT